MVVVAHRRCRLLQVLTVRLQNWENFGVFLLSVAYGRWSLTRRSCTWRFHCISTCTLTYWLALGNCRCLVTEAIIAQDTNVDLEVNSQGSKRKKKRQIKQQVDDEGYPSKFFPITEKINRYSIIFLSVRRYKSLILSNFNPVPKLYVEQFFSQSQSTYLSCLFQRGKTWALTSGLLVKLSLMG